MTTPKKLGLAAAGLVAAGALIAGGNLVANADTSTSSATASSESSPGYGGRTAGEDRAAPATEVTADEADQVAAAVTAENPDVTVESVRLNPDGSYGVLGSAQDEPVFYEVSADLATVTLHDMADGMGPGGHGPGGNAPKDGEQPAMGDQSDSTAANGTSA